MSLNEKNTGGIPGEKELADTLGNFRQSVHAWSDAAYSRPRTEIHVARSDWRLAAAWALGCVLALGSLSTGVYEHHRGQVAARMKAEQEARQQQVAAQERARIADEDFLAEVDSDVARTVPAAMEPLAQLMDESESQ